MPRLLIPNMRQETSLQMALLKRGGRRILGKVGALKLKDGFPWSGDG